jgi:chromosome segregation ATPase
VSERKEPTVSSVLDGKEELSGRRAQAVKQIKRSSAASSSASMQKPVNNSGSSGFTWFVFLITLCVGGAAGYALWQVEMTQQTLQNQRLRIVQLESKLAVSDDSATQSLASVSAQVRGLNSKTIQADAEIAKLWATRKVNRDGITKAVEKLAALDKKTTNKIGIIEKTQKKIPTLSKSIASLETSVTELQPLKSKLLSTTQTVTEQDILLRAIREKISVQSELLKTLGAQANKGVSAANKLKNIDKRLKETEAALTSLEAFRRTTNRDLLQLKKP